MAPHGDAIVPTFAPKTNLNKPPTKLSTDGQIQRTKSDISFELIKEAALDAKATLQPISEVEDAKCDCCSMSEECTPRYIAQVREKFCGKLICGLCSEAVKEEEKKNGGNISEALNTHMSACVRFNKFGRAYPVLYQAKAMKEILKKKAKAEEGMIKKGGIARTSSCFPAITRDMNNLTMAS